MYFLVKQNVQQEVILFICQDLIGSWKIGILGRDVIGKYVMIGYIIRKKSFRAREDY